LVKSAGVSLCRTRVAVRGYRFPPEIISRAVWLFHRFALSHRDIEELLAERGIQVSYEAIRLWCHKFGPLLACELRRRCARRQVVPGRAGALEADDGTEPRRGGNVCHIGVAQRRYQPARMVRPGLR
jgi:hypothetical protein